MSAIRTVIGGAALVLAAVLSGCAPGGATPDTTSAASSSPTGAPTSSATPDETAGATPDATATPGVGDIALPADCRDIYSAAMIASLEQQNPPLNDPGLTMLSSGDAALLEMIDTLPTLRCSWGRPSETGLSTNVSLVDPAQSDAVAAELAAAGFGCEEQDAATVCRIEQRGLSLDDVEFVRGETHALRGNVWVATAWLNFSPEGYTEDILATLGR